MNELEEKMQIIMLPNQKVVTDRLPIGIVKITKTFEGIKSYVAGELGYNTNGEYMPERVINLYQPQHLYICSNREIKEGELRWILNIKTNRVYKINPVDKLDWTTELIIVASTDKSLGLPEPSIDFIKEYVEKQGDIKEIMVDMEEHFMDDVSIYYSKEVKVRRDNTIIISKVEEDWLDVYDKFLDSGYPRVVPSFINWCRDNHYHPPIKINK